MAAGVNSTAVLVMKGPGPKETTGAIQEILVRLQAAEDAIADLQNP
jgi:hypothetical protein